MFSRSIRATAVSSSEFRIRSEKTQLLFEASPLDRIRLIDRIELEDLGTTMPKGPNVTNSHAKQ